MRWVTQYPGHMRDASRLTYVVSLARTAVTALLPIFLLSGALGYDTLDFSGIWVEIQPDSGPPLRMQLTQSGSRVQVRMSYRDSFPDRIFGAATIENGSAIWTSPETCAERFRWPGYNYDNPGVDTITLSLRPPTGQGESGPQLVYVQEIRWNAPCANNHPIGTERIQKILKRRVQHYFVEQDQTPAMIR